MEDKIIANLKWPPELKNNIITMDSSYQPSGNVHLMSVKGFLFYSNPMSSYGGNLSQLTPQDFLLISLSSCQFLTFYSLAVKARLGLIYYEDNSEMFLGGNKIKFSEKIVLDLKMKFNETQKHDKVLELCHKAYKYCIIGNSIKTNIEFKLEII